MSNELERLPTMISAAVAALNSATVAAEVLEAKRQAGAAYDIAKVLGRIKDAHATVIEACHRMQRDALIIETRADIRLANEYDAAQERGEVQKAGGDRKSEINILQKNNDRPTVADIGVTSKEIHAARLVRDAEQEKPGIVQKVLDEKLAAGLGPTRADVKRATARPHAEVIRSRMPAPTPDAAHSVAVTDAPDKDTYCDVCDEDVDWDQASCVCNRCLGILLERKAAQQ